MTASSVAAAARRSRVLVLRGGEHHIVAISLCHSRVLFHCNRD
jgi:hypothetical protein